MSDETLHTIPQEAREKIDLARTTHPYEIYKDLFPQKVKEMREEVDKKYAQLPWARFDTDTIIDNVVGGFDEEALFQAKRLIRQEGLENITPQQIVEQHKQLVQDLRKLNDSITDLGEMTSPEEYYHQAVTMIENKPDPNDYTLNQNLYKIAKRYLDEPLRLKAEKYAYDSEYVELQKNRRLESAQKILNLKQYPNCLPEDTEVATALEVVLEDTFRIALSQKKNSPIAFPVKYALNYIYNWREIWPNSNEIDAKYKHMHPPLSTQNIDAQALETIRDFITNKILTDTEYTKDKPDLKNILIRCGLLE